MCAFKSIKPSDATPTGGRFGTGINIEYDQAQQWAYIRHQMPSEIILLKCYDTAQGADGSALYCGHVAAQLDEPIDGVPMEPRNSIEVRLVAVWE